MNTSNFWAHKRKKLMDSSKGIEALGGYHLEALDPDSLLTHLGPHTVARRTRAVPHLHSLRHHQRLCGLAFCLPER